MAGPGRPHRTGQHSGVARSPEPGQQAGDRAQHRPLGRPHAGPTPVGDQSPVVLGRRERVADPGVDRRLRRAGDPGHERRVRRSASSSAASESGPRPLDVDGEVGLTGAVPHVRGVRVVASPTSARMQRRARRRSGHPRSRARAARARRHQALGRILGGRVRGSLVPPGGLVETALEQLVAAADRAHLRRRHGPPAPPRRGPAARARLPSTSPAIHAAYPLTAHTTGASGLRSSGSASVTRSAHARTSGRRRRNP